MQSKDSKYYMLLLNVVVEWKAFHVLILVCIFARFRNDQKFVSNACDKRTIDKEQSRVEYACILIIFSVLFRAYGADIFIYEIIGLL